MVENLTPLHPVPECFDVGNRVQCPRDYMQKDPMLEQATEGTLAGALIRIIAHYRPETGVWSRQSKSYQVFNGLDGLSWMHAARSNAADVLQQIAVNLPEVAAYAWGPQQAERMKFKEYDEGLVDEYPKGTHPQEKDWLLAGWHAIAGRPDVQRVITNWWWEDNVTKVLKWMEAEGLSRKATLAAGVRVRNTSHTLFNQLKKAVAELGEDIGVEQFMSTYKDGDYLSILKEWPVLQGDIITWPTPDDIQWPAAEGVPSGGAPSGNGEVPSGNGDVAPAGWGNGTVPPVTTKTSTWKKVGYVAGGLSLAGLLGLGIWMAVKPKRRRRR